MKAENEELKIRIQFEEDDQEKLYHIVHCQEQEIAKAKENDKIKSKSYEDQIENLESNVNEKDSKVQKLQQSICDLRRELESEVTQKSDKISKLESCKELLETKLACQDKKIKIYNVEFEALKKTNSDLRKEIEVNKSEHEKVQRHQLDVHQLTIADHEETLEARNRKMEILEAEKAKLQHQLRAKDEEIRKLEKSSINLSTHRNCIKTFKKQNSDLKSQFENLEMLNNNLVVKIEAKDDQIDDLEIQVNAKNLELESLKKRLLQKDSDIEDVKFLMDRLTSWSSEVDSRSSPGPEVTSSTSSASRKRKREDLSLSQILADIACSDSDSSIKVHTQ